MTEMLLEPLRNLGEDGIVRSLNRLLRGFGTNTSVVIETRTQALGWTHADAWFVAEAWQAGEREVDVLVERGEISVFDDIDAFLAHLDETATTE